MPSPMPTTSGADRRASRGSLARLTGAASRDAARGRGHPAARTRARVLRPQVAAHLVPGEVQPGVALDRVRRDVRAADRRHPARAVDDHAVLIDLAGEVNGEPLRGLGRELLAGERRGSRELRRPDWLWRRRRRRGLDGPQRRRGRGGPRRRLGRVGCHRLCDWSWWARRRRLRRRRLRRSPLCSAGDERRDERGGQPDRPEELPHAGQSTAGEARRCSRWAPPQTPRVRAGSTRRPSRAARTRRR